MAGMPSRHSSSGERTKLPVVLLAGATAVGKTELSLLLASRLGSEIVNADSMQVYRHMDIGTAKPSKEERAMIPHHLLDVVDPREPFDASRYLELARPVIDRLHGEGRIPVVVGGTGLYMKVLIHGLCPGPPTDPELREALLREEARRGLESLHGELMKLDPVAGGRIHPHDRQRTLRALEVYRLTGVPLSRWQEPHRFRAELYPALKIFLYREREILYRRIDARVLAMMEAGFLEEVKGLFRMGYGPELNPMQSLGYRQLVQHVTGELDLQEAVERIRMETRRYAKRQHTWFRGDSAFQWLPADRPDEVLMWILREMAK